MAPYPVVSRGIGRNAPSSIELFDTHAAVELTKGLVAIIDLDDVEQISGYRWTASVNSYGHAYAVRFESKKCFLMHRVILEAASGLHVDHIDGNGLNNRRSNIRICTPSQNAANRWADRRNLLGLKGVYGRRGHFVAQITKQGRKFYIGSFKTKEEAAAAYFGAAKVLFEEFARA